MKRCGKFKKIKNGEYSGVCQEKDKLEFNKPYAGQITRGPCNNTAKWSFKGWRFGDVAKGEESIVDTMTYFCDDCRNIIEESMEEAKWEARVS